MEKRVVISNPEVTTQLAETRRVSQPGVGFGQRRQVRQSESPVQSPVRVLNPHSDNPELAVQARGLSPQEIVQQPEIVPYPQTLEQVNPESLQSHPTLGTQRQEFVNHGLTPGGLTTRERSSTHSSLSSNDSGASFHAAAQAYIDRMGHSSPPQGQGSPTNDFSEPFLTTASPTRNTNTTLSVADQSIQIQLHQVRNREMELRIRMRAQEAERMQNLIQGMALNNQQLQTQLLLAQTEKDQQQALLLAQTEKDQQNIQSEGVLDHDLINRIIGLVQPRLSLVQIEPIQGVRVSLRATWNKFSSPVYSWSIDTTQVLVKAPKIGQNLKTILPCAQSKPISIRISSGRVESIGELSENKIVKIVKVVKVLPANPLKTQISKLDPLLIGAASKTPSGWIEANVNESVYRILKSQKAGWIRTDFPLKKLGLKGNSFDNLFSQDDKHSKMNQGETVKQKENNELKEAQSVAVSNEKGTKTKTGQGLKNEATGSINLGPDNDSETLAKSQSTDCNCCHFVNNNYITKQYVTKEEVQPMAQVKTVTVQPMAQVKTVTVYGAGFLGLGLLGLTALYLWSTRDRLETFIKDLINGLNSSNSSQSTNIN